MKIGIRADGGSIVGMGHIVRCLSLAKAFANRGHQIIFISQDPTGIGIINKSGFEIQVIRSCGKNEEISKIKSIISAKMLDCLIIDSYQVDRQYFLNLKQVVPLLGYIDDLNRFIYSIDFLINGNIAAEELGYTGYSEREMLLLGIRYNLIREEFGDLPAAKVRPVIARVLVTTGGTDLVNLSTKIINAIRLDATMNHIVLDVVVGGGNQFKDEITNLSKKYPNVCLHHNVDKISVLMRRADLAISAGGSTLYELCACGLPTLAVIIADNQQFIVEELAKSGYIKNLGWHGQLDFRLLREEINGFRYEERLSAAMKMQGLVDGNGAKRVVEAVERYFIIKEG